MIEKSWKRRPDVTRAIRPATNERRGFKSGACVVYNCHSSLLLIIRPPLLIPRRHRERACPLPNVLEETPGNTKERYYQGHDSSQKKVKERDKQHHPISSNFITSGATSFVRHFFLLFEVFICTKQSQKC